jgi:hypothetical protein
VLVLVVVSSRAVNRAIEFGWGTALVAFVTLVVFRMVHAVNQYVDPELQYWPWLAGAAVIAVAVLVPGRIAVALGNVLAFAILLVRLAIAIACLPIVLVTVLCERKRPPPEPRWKGVG